MITLKTAAELQKMRAAGKVAAGALSVGGEQARAGMSTHEIDKAIHKFIVNAGAKPSFLHYNGFPASACISINNELIHGIPSKKRILKEGDIVSIDVGACLNGYHGDTAATFAVGEISSEAQKLLKVTEESLYKGINAAKIDGRIGDISAAIQAHCESNGFAVVRQFIGHGIGSQLHEPPDVPNFGQSGKGARLAAGMTIAIEPMINAAGEDVKVLSDGWTVVTESGSLCAHFEHTVAITASGVSILTVE